MTKVEKLSKLLEDPSQVALDLERLERSHSSIKSEVQNIESSLNWANVRALVRELKSFELALEETERIVEQGNLGRNNT